MTENEAIEVIYDKIETCEFYFAEKDRYPKWCEYEFLEALGVAISALKEVRQYREMERKLEEAYGKCDGILEVVIDNLYLHKGRDIGKPRKATLLTDDSVDMWEAYKQIGTVEECREAVEKQKPKKPHRNYKKFSGLWCKCGWYLGQKQCLDIKYCPNCGQAIDENLEGKEDE